MGGGGRVDGRASGVLRENKEGTEARKIGEFKSVVTGCTEDWHGEPSYQPS